MIPKTSIAEENIGSFEFITTTNSIKMHIMEPTINVVRTQSKRICITLNHDMMCNIAQNRNRKMNSRSAMHLAASIVQIINDLEIMIIIGLLTESIENVLVMHIRKHVMISVNDPCPLSMAENRRLVETKIDINRPTMSHIINEDDSMWEYKNHPNIMIMEMVYNFIE